MMSITESLADSTAVVSPVATVALWLDRSKLASKFCNASLAADACGLSARSCSSAASIALSMLSHRSGSRGRSLASARSQLVFHYSRPAEHASGILAAVIGLLRERNKNGRTALGVDGLMDFDGA
jgi:hypothetical protein